MNNIERVLIIGINSFLGRSIYKRLFAHYEVTGVYHKSVDLVPKNISLMQIDEIEKLRDIFKYVFLVSSYVPQAGDTDVEQRLYNANVKLPVTIRKLFPNSRIIFCSSVSVYENVLNNLSIDETTAPSPKSAYGISKLWGEEIVSQHKSYSILRISSMYGIGMRRSTFLPKIILSALDTRKITLLGDGSRFQNYVHVDDVAKDAITAAKSETNDVVLAIGNGNFSNIEIANMVKATTGCDIVFSGIDKSKSFSYIRRHKSINNEKNVDIRNGINELIEWIAK